MEFSGWNLSFNVFYQNMPDMIDHVCYLQTINRPLDSNHHAMKHEYEDQFQRCITQMTAISNQVRDRLRQEYDDVKDFNLIRMGLWNYRNILWVRSKVLRDESGAFLEPKRPIHLAELCEIFPSRAIPTDLLTLAHDYRRGSPLK